MLLRAAILLLVIISSASLVSGQRLRINNFGPNNYKASPNNYSGFEANDGIWYFANENGVLEYDGSSWQLITIDNYSSVHSLLHDPNNVHRIFVGGNNEFGYLEKDTTSLHYTYHSLRHQISSEPLSEIWNIISIGRQTYFECREKIISYNGIEVKTIDIKDAYLFTIQNRLFASVYNHGLAKISDNGPEYINDKFAFDSDAAFHSLDLLNSEDRNDRLLITSFNGLHKFNVETSEVEKWESQVDDLLIKDGVADAVIWRDSLYAITTISSGLIFLDEQGNVQKGLGQDVSSSEAKDQIETPFDELDPKIEGLINEENGLPTNQLRGIFQDVRGNLWVSSLYGISHLTWDSDFIQNTYEPNTVLRKAILNTSDTASTRSILFGFATPGYDRSDLEYSFYLEGFEETWLPWTDQVEKEYTNLDGGAYKFHVKARTNEGIETQEVEYFFTVPTLWYKNPWTYLFGLSLLSILIYFGVRYRTLRLKNLNRRLEEVIENRTRELILQREQLKAANEELIITNTELDNFVYRSSHDLVAPLKSIRGLVIVAKKDEPSDNQMEYLSMMEKSVLKLEEFIKSIMEYSSNAKKEIKYTKVVLTNVINEVLDELKFYKNVDKVEVVKNFNEETTVISDPERLKIILSNLITNAIKYHNYNQHESKIWVNLTTDASNYRIEIADNGYGIESQHLSKIFEMFYRASNSSEGSGLGLYIVKDTAAKLSGEISVKSEPGKGSTFVVTLPIKSVS